MSAPNPVTDTGHTESVNPATGESLGFSPVHGLHEVRAAMDGVRRAQPAWARTPLATRKQHMSRVRDYLVEHADRIARVISEDVGKTRVEALATEVVPAATSIHYYVKNARRFLKDERLTSGSWLFVNKRSTVHRVPYGVVGIIAPWNYPLGIPIHEIVPALLAGNGVVFKTARETQEVGKVLEAAMAAAHLPEGLFASVNIPGASAGPAFLHEGGVDKLFFTGSVAVGKQLMAMAAERLMPVSLELGGNDAMLVCEDAHVERAVYGAMWGGLQNAGQSCAGVERVYVHQAVFEGFLERLKGRVEALRLGADRNYDVDVGALCTRRQVQSVQHQIDDAIAKGARIHAQVPVPERYADGAFMPLTVLVDTAHDMTIMRDETFGPVLCVVKVRDMDEAVTLANGTSLGLTASVWSRDRAKAKRLARRLETGAVTINDHLLSHGLPEAPWGGFKESGVGRSHGRLGFDEMTQPQVVVDDWLHGATRNIWWHPYGRDVYLGIKGALDALHGRGLGIRARGLAAFVRLVPRMFRGD